MLLDLFGQTDVCWSRSENKDSAGIQYWQAEASFGLILRSKLSSSPLISWSFLELLQPTLLLFSSLSLNSNCACSVKSASYFISGCNSRQVSRKHSEIPKDKSHGLPVLLPGHLNGCRMVPHTCLVTECKLTYMVFMALPNLHNDKHHERECVFSWLWFLLARRQIFSNLYIEQTFDSSLASWKKWLSWVLHSTLGFPLAFQSLSQNFVETVKIFKEQWTPLQES